MGGCCGWADQSVVIEWLLWVGVPECYDRVGVVGGRTRVLC